MSAGAELVVFEHDAIRCTPTEEAVALRDAILERSALVGAVRNAIHNEAAIAAMKEIRGMLNRVEDARKTVKEPVLDLCRRIDATAKKFAEELKAEEVRIAKAAADWQTEQLERVREQERRRQAELARIEAERQAELARIRAEAERAAQEAAAQAAAKAAAAKSAAEREAIEARAKAEAMRIALEAEKQALRQGELRNQEIESLPTVQAPTRTEGQTVRAVWLFEVTDIWLLARTNPGLVRIEPCRQEINEVIGRLAEAGAGEPKVAGLRIWKETKVGVRTGKDRLIEV